MNDISPLGSREALLTERVRRYNAVFKSGMSNAEFYSSAETAQMIEWLKDLDFRLVLAQNDETDPATLAQLANRGPQSVRTAVFAHLETDPELKEIVLDLIVMDSFREAGASLAKSVGLSSDDLDDIAEQRAKRFNR